MMGGDEPLPYSPPGIPGLLWPAHFMRSDAFWTHNAAALGGRAAPAVRRPPWPDHRKPTLEGERGSGPAIDSLCNRLYNGFLGFETETPCTQ